jgi:hypothetical protein
VTLHTSVEIQDHLNATGSTYDTDRACGSINAWGNTFPAEELPFGRTLLVAGIPFLLPNKSLGRDHIEALGQTLFVSNVKSARGIALLCCGEMGNQELEIEIYWKRDVVLRTVAVAREWLSSEVSAKCCDSFMCSHLHYVGGYELALVKPTLWCCHLHCHTPSPISHIRLGLNPLFHIFALTILHGANDDI